MLDIKAINPAFLDSRDVNHDAFRECESNREIVLIKCPSCAHLMAWCCECDTLFPDLRSPQILLGLAMTDSQRDRVECFRCHEHFPDFYFLRPPFIEKYLVTRAEVVEAGLEGLLTHPQLVVERFNACINAANLDGLSSLMTEDHTLIDSAGSSVFGKAAVTAAWSSFFAAFPDYRNEFQTLHVRGDDVLIVGRSDCSDTRLKGPALWRARVREDKVSLWQVYEDTPEARVHLGL